MKKIFYLLLLIKSASFGQAVTFYSTNKQIMDSIRAWSDSVKVRPTLTAVQVLPPATHTHDWASSDILNKPTIPVVLTTALTGYVSGAGTLAATDNVLQGFNKLNGNVSAVTTTANNAAPKASPVFTGIATVPSIKYGRRALADVAATLATSDFMIAYTSITATRAVTLPTAASTTNQFFIIKDESGSAASFNITIVGTVDGAVNPTAINTARGVYRIYSNGTNFFTW